MDLLRKALLHHSRMSYEYNGKLRLRIGECQGPLHYYGSKTEYIELFTFINEGMVYYGVVFRPGSSSGFHGTEMVSVHTDK